MILTPGAFLLGLCLSQNDTTHTSHTWPATCKGPKYQHRVYFGTLAGCSFPHSYPPPFPPYQRHGRIARAASRTRPPGRLGTVALPPGFRIRNTSSPQSSRFTTNSIAQSAPALAAVGHLCGVVIDHYRHVEVCSLGGPWTFPGTVVRRIAAYRVLHFGMAAKER